MASEVDIANLALSRLGDDATVASLNPPEGSAQAEHCARFYPVARDALLEMHTWAFATRRAVLAPLTGAAIGWQFAYALPANCIRALSVLPLDARDDQHAQDFVKETLPDGAVAIFTDLPEATLHYTARVTDTTKFSPLFVDALGWLLASYLAGPILKGDAGMKAAQQMFAVALNLFGRAGVSDANQRHGRLEHTPEWISARGANMDRIQTWGR